MVALTQHALDRQKVDAHDDPLDLGLLDAEPVGERSLVEQIRLLVLVVVFVQVEQVVTVKALGDQPIGGWADLRRVVISQLGGHDLVHDQVEARVETPRGSGNNHLRVSSRSVTSDHTVEPGDRGSTSCGGVV